MPNGFSPSTNHLAANLSFTNFLFVVPRADDDAAGTRLKGIGSLISRGFFNDFDADGARDTQPHETIQFLVSDGDSLEAISGLRGFSSGSGDRRLSAARYAVQVCGKYRPRLDEVEAELRRRLGDAGEVIALDGAERSPRYTSSEMYEYAYRRAAVRTTGRHARNAFVLPVSKSAEWWQKPALERHAYFYPHVDSSTACHVNGHARTAEHGIATIFRRLFHNPDGYGRPGEFDFITYFECDDQHVDTFERIHHALRDTTRNPEWRYVQEGPLWRGRRVLRW
jgi:hypothetical protein